ncbi:MAG: MBL fold metallo-hydrolase [Promethearchaeota archaeon]
MGSKKMDVTILGTGASLLSPDRALAGLMVEISGEPLLFDIGPGVLHRLSCTMMDLTRIEHVFISHFHVDHCSDIAALIQSLWLAGYNKTLRIYGPKHLKKAAKGLNMIFPYLMDKVKLHFENLSPNYEKKTEKWKVTSFPVIHGDIEAYGFLIEAEKKRIVYSGDTAPCQELMKAAKGADLLIHECSLPDKLKEKAPLHTTPGDLGRLAAEAGVKVLVITHLYPELLEDLSGALSSIRASFSGKIIVPSDTQIIVI